MAKAVLVTAVFGVLLSALPALAAPSCRIRPGNEETGEANAGCFVVVEDRLLLVHERFRGVLALPGGTSRPGETAQCTAARETWEEAGIEVEVGPRLHTFENGFRLFACYWQPSQEVVGDRLPAPSWVLDEVDDVLLLRPEAIRSESYRYPGQLGFLVELHRQLCSESLGAP